MADARDRLQQQVSVMISPEGTRSRNGELRPYEDVAFRLALEAGVPIVPLVVAGTRDAMAKGSFRFQRARARVKVLAPIETAGLTVNPVARESSVGPVPPALPAFTGFVFKVQANMDLRHRDRVAFLRVCSGRYAAGLDVTHVRTGRSFKLAPPQQFLGRARVFAEEALPGDVVGVHDRGSLRIGDTLASPDAPRGPDGKLLEYLGIPRFAPEHFARIISKDPLRRKALDKGLRELTEEGAAQVFFAETQLGPVPIVGAVGLLQFDVMVHRLENEYGAPCMLEKLPFRFPRWMTGPDEEIQRLGESQDLSLLYDAKNHPVILFRDEWRLRWALERTSGLTFHEAAP